MTDKKLIAKFMGFEYGRIGYEATTDETKWQKKNHDWLKKPEIIDQYDNSVGEYFANIEADLLISVDDVDYAGNWSDLMPVVEKIISLGIDINIDADRVFIHANNLIHVRNEDHGSKIETVYTAVVECIKSFESAT